MWVHGHSPPRLARGAHRCVDPAPWKVRSFVAFAVATAGRGTQCHGRRPIACAEIVVPRIVVAHPCAVRVPCPRRPG